MKLSKKIIITAVLVLVVAICGGLVWLLSPGPELQVGSIFDGESIEDVMLGDITYSDVEEEIAERTKIVVLSMEATSETRGKITFRVTTLDVEAELDAAASGISKDDKVKFIAELSKIMHDKIDRNEITRNREPERVEAEIVYDGGRWKIIPEDELISLFKGNIARLIEEAAK